MKKLTSITLVFLFYLFLSKTVLSQSQDAPIHPSIIGNGVFHGESPPLRDIPAMSADEFAIIKEKAEKKALNKKLKYRSYPFAATALPKGEDQAWQNFMGKTIGSKAPIVNFSGQASPYYPPDANGTAGPNHYMQTINSVYTIYNKTGTIVAGPSNMNTLFTGVTGSNCNDGDPLILYDDQAGRWLAVEFSICGSNDFMLVAVSTTNDPTGTWYKYSFDVADMPDYEKFGIWQDGYYMGTNNSSGNDIYVFQRSVMLTGGTSPQMVGFNNAWRPTTIDGFMCVPPVDNDGPFAPAGSPGLFVTINDDAIGGGSDQLWIYELTVNWTTPSSSTFIRTQQINVTAFNSNFGTTWDNISQPTTQKLDAIPQVIMNVPQYRNFGAYQTIVCCHTVNVDGTNHAGIRWYELRKTATTWTIRQQGTYAPDAPSRWMGSVMLNGYNQIGLGYSVSSSTVYPGIRYCGQSSGAYSSATGIMDIAEDVIQTGAYAQSSYNRWGDYALMSVDPSDDKTFWFTTEYIGSGGTRQTKIASFKFGNSPTATTMAATAITGTTATLNGTINPNGLATTYYFQWGLTTSYGNTTTSTSAGSGTSNVNVSADITGLTSGATYHFRVVGVNSDGTTNGNDMTVVPGAATVTTTAVSSITSTTASSGGNVTSDGGSTVTARGVCWGTAVNPVATGNHTTDGSGTGTYSSSITGLSASTTYHVRAYATNANGTYYGTDIQFTTPCGTITTFPWNEGFENAGSIPTCWTQEQVNSSGINWTFITGSGNSHPAAAHGGTFNACLKDVTSADNKTRLITPPLNLTSVNSPQLKFWHTQAFWSPDQDQLTVFYKTSASGTWTQLVTYTANIAVWTQETINLPNPGSDYYIAFEGNAKWGYGVCVDDVSISSSCTSYLPVSVSISASVNPVCAGTSVTFTATPTNGGTTPAYQWKVNGINAGTNSSTYSYVPVNNDVVTCVLTSNATCVTGNPATSNSLTIIVNSLLPVSVSIAPSANPVCAGTSVTFTPAPVNGGTPSYQWYKNSVAAGTGSTYSYVPVNGDQVYVIMTSSLTCKSGSPATSNIVTMTVNPVLPVSVTIAPSENQVCAGTSVTFTPTPVNGGTPTYQWFKNSVAVSTGSTYSCVPVNDDQLYVIMTSDLTCTTGSPATSNIVTMTVNPVLPVSVTIAPSENQVCAGTSITFTPTPVNGGTPTYQWFKNSVAVSTGSTYSCVPVNDDQLYVIMTSDLTCTTGSPATSNTLIMTVDPALQVGISIAPSENPVLAGTTVTFTATPSNGGTSPVYQWKINGTNAGTNSPAYSYIPADGDQITCTLTSDVICATGNPAISNVVTMIVNPLTLSVDPSNKDVTDPSGIATFNVTSNTSWTVISDQAWCTVDPSGSGNGTIYANYTENTSVDPRIANVTVTVTGLTPVVITVTQAGKPNKVLNLKVYLEGLYTGAGMMRQAFDETGPHFGAGIVDQVIVELHNATNYSAVEYNSGPVNLSTTGNVAINDIPATLNGSYYITVKHRNSIETTTAQPVSFTGSTISYDFSTAASQAYGGNLFDLDGLYVIYGGEVYQDGLIDLSDMVLVESDINLFATGYLVTDVNGDGLVDLTDMILVEQNINLFISSILP